MLSPLPAGSVIKVQAANDGYELSWENPTLGGFARFGSAAFLIFWLCGWAVGEVFVIMALIKGDKDSMPGFVKIFLIAWLGGWTVGGIFAMKQVRLLLRRPRPDHLLLNRGQLNWKPGDIVPSGHGSREQRQEWMALKKSRPRQELVVSRAQVENIKLEQAGDRQRLTFDFGAERYEIGSGLREPEREWLHALLVSWKQSPG